MSLHHWINRLDIQGMLFKFAFFSKWKPTVEEFSAPLVTPLPFQSKLDHFPKGIDNAHIDVILSAKLMDAARLLTHMMIRHDVNENLSWGLTWVVPPTAREVTNFQRAYESMMESAIGMCRKTPHRELVQLAEFATLKFLLVLVGEEMDLFRDDLQRQRGHGRSGNKKTVQIHDRLVALAREMPAIRYRVAQQLFAHVLKVESSSLRRLRKSLLGRSWLVPREVMFNPILLLPSLWNEDLTMRNYPLAGINCEKLEEFAEVNLVVTGLFADYLPEWTQPPMLPEEAYEMDGGKLPLRMRTDQGSLPGFLDVELLLSRALCEEEYQQGKTSWLDDPANMERALHAHAPPPADDKNRIAFHTHLLKEAQIRFKSLGLLKKIYAAHAAPAVFDELQGRVPVRLIVEYLEGNVSRRKMATRLASTKVADAGAALKRLDAAESALRHLSVHEQQRCLVDFMVRFVSLRRDLKLAYRAYWNMNQIRILKDPAHIGLARRNRTLHEFVLPEEQACDQREIRGHVILKADLRGSSKIIRELRERNLNPATHFSLNFFDPVSSLLERFGAKKVFVEGDAVILCIYEYQESPHDWLAISRAAGLARNILAVVDAQNAQNRKYNLPELELGMGIAWLGEAPAFLYDGEHEIMISPAIHRSDRLSSCAASLRKTPIGETLPRGVEVVEPVGQGIMQKDSGDSLLRYNVNGIELDPVAFPKLQEELVLHRVETPFPQYSPQSVFYIGRYPDKNGQMQWLVVREAPVRLWIGNEIDGEGATGRLFYEIVTDPDVMAQLKTKMAATAHSSTQIARPAL